MEKIVAKLVVFFEEPFWVGIYEREYGGRFEVCKITFGAEPKDYEVYDFLLKNWNHFRFRPGIVVIDPVLSFAPISKGLSHYGKV